MDDNSSVPSKWHKLIIDSLSSDSSDDKVFALDFLSKQTSISLDFCKEIMPNIIQAVVSPDAKVRLYARKARNHILDSFPEIDINAQTNIEPFKLHLEEGEKLSAQQILLYKLRLRSRYVVFEAMDRLTESGDSSLVEPLIDYLNNEKDEHKVAYLLRLMGKFDDKRVPELLETYLDHEDSRIVANALEALCEFNVPDLSPKFVELAKSEDNRVKGNAIRCLYRYSPKEAEQYISDMVKSQSYSMQDIGVFLLRAVRPSNLGELLNIINNSKYADIRLKALDIAPPSKEEVRNAELLLNEDIEQPNENRDLAFFVGFIVLSACLFVITDASNKYMLALLFVGIAILTIIRPNKTRTSIQKTAISMGLISSIIMGNTRLMLIPLLMGLWLTWIGSRFNYRGKLEKISPEYIFAWFFSITSILATQFIQEKYDVVLRLTNNILQETSKFNLSNEKIAGIANIVGRQWNFQVTIYVFIAVMTISIITINRWFPKKDNKNLCSLKHLMIVSAIFFVCIIILNSFHLFGLKILLQTNGFSNPTDILKLLLP